MNGIAGDKCKGRCPLCSRGEAIKHVLIGEKLLKEKCLNVNKELTYREILISTNKDQLRSLGRYLDRVKYKWFNETKEM